MNKHVTTNSSKSLRKLTRCKLIYFEGGNSQSFAITSLGYDFLSINSLVKRRIAFSLGNQIGVGKESDVFEIAGKRRGILVLKLHKLGRSSFRRVKNNRELCQITDDKSWNHLSRKSAFKEFSVMRALHENGFAVPYAIECNRHGLLMRKIKGIQLSKVHKVLQVNDKCLIQKRSLGLLSQMASVGLIHCDFNEYNLIFSDDKMLVMIDFPQMISTSHPNAKLLFERDTTHILNLIKRIDKLDIQSSQFLVRSDYPIFDEIIEKSGSLDMQLPVCKYDYLTLKKN
jgi:RIO kinase 2